MHLIYSVARSDDSVRVAIYGKFDGGGGVRIYDFIVYLTFVATGGALLDMIISPFVLARFRYD